MPQNLPELRKVANHAARHPLQKWGRMLKLPLFLASDDSSREYSYSNALMLFVCQQTDAPKFGCWYFQNLLPATTFTPDATDTKLNGNHSFVFGCQHV
jgi:hypothetical protein